MDQVAEYLKYLVQGMVAWPEDVKVTHQTDEMGVLMNINVHQDDMGRVIGRKGETSKALRTIMRVVGSRYDARVNVKILEPEGSTRPAYQRDTTMDELKKDLA